MSAASPAAAIWHDLECGAYEADLALWSELADEAAAPVLDLGCGTGRVALHLAGSGHPVVGLDLEPSLAEALRRRAAQLPVEVEVGDARSFDLGRRFGLVLAPMQLLQLFAGSSERIACLRCCARHLLPGGLLAAAIVEDLAPAATGAPPLPDARELDGWVYSSLPLETAIAAGALAVRRLRQTVGPTGNLSEELSEVRLGMLDASTLEREARPAGLRPAGRRRIPPTADHVGSTVVLLAKEG